MVRDGGSRTAKRQVTEKTMTRLAMTIAIAVTLGMMGCTTMTPQQQGTVTGAAIGAAAGAGIAAISGGSGWTGAAPR